MPQELQRSALRQVYFALLRRTGGSASGFCPSRQDEACRLRMHGLGQTSMQTRQEGGASPNLECFWLQLFNGSGSLFGKRPHPGVSEPPLMQQELLRRQQWRQMVGTARRRGMPPLFASRANDSLETLQLWHRHPGAVSRNSPAMVPPSRSSFLWFVRYETPQLWPRHPGAVSGNSPAMAAPSRSSFL